MLKHVNSKHPSLITSFFFGHRFVQNLTTSLCTLVIIIKKQLELLVFFSDCLLLIATLTQELLLPLPSSFIARCIASNTKSKYWIKTKKQKLHPKISSIVRFTN